VQARRVSTALRMLKVGLPKPIVDKMLKKAVESGFKASLKSDVPTAGGYYWVNSDCSKAPLDAVSYVGIQDAKLFNMAPSMMLLLALELMRPSWSSILS